MCTPEDTLAHYLGAPSIDNVMRHNTLIPKGLHIFCTVHSFVIGKDDRV